MSLTRLRAQPCRPEPPSAARLEKCELRSRGVAVCWLSLLTNGAFSQTATATNLTDSQQNSISVVKMLAPAAGALSLVACHVENHPDPGVAGHHALVGFRGVLEWQHFDHGRDCMLGAEG